MKKNELFEVIGEIDENKISRAEKAVSKNKLNVWVKCGSLVACLALLLSVGIPSLHRFSSVSPVDDGITDYESVNAEKYDDLKENVILINEAESAGCSDIDAKTETYNGKLPERVWNQIMKDFKEFSGISYFGFLAKIPDGWDFNGFYSVSTRGYKDAMLENEYKLHDYVFKYRKDGGEATIALCSFEAPVRDVYITCDDPKVSLIGDTELVIYGYGNSYMTQFTVDGLNYDVETENINVSELTVLLTSLASVQYSKSGDVAADETGIYLEAVGSDTLSDDVNSFFGGLYTDGADVVVILTENTPENRAAVCKELGINEEDTVFETGNYTLEYLTEVQNRIGSAMTDGELTFVVSSGIYENINRIKVRVSSDDADNLKKVKSFDRIGGAIEFELIANN